MVHFFIRVNRLNYTKCYNMTNKKWAMDCVTAEHLLDMWWIDVILNTQLGSLDSDQLKSSAKLAGHCSSSAERQMLCW